MLSDYICNSQEINYRPENIQNNLNIVKMVMVDSTRARKRLLDYVNDTSGSYGFLLSIFKERIVEHDLSNSIDDFAMLFIVSNEMISPAEVIVFLIELVSYYDQTGKVADINVICNELYPNGFYSLMTTLDIYSYMKIMKVNYSYII